MDSKSVFSNSSSKHRSTHDRSTVLDSTERNSSVHSTTASCTKHGNNFFSTALRQRSSNTFNSTLFNPVSKTPQKSSQTRPIGSKNAIESNKENFYSSFQKEKTLKSNLLYAKNTEFDVRQIKNKTPEVCSNYKQYLDEAENFNGTGSQGYFTPQNYNGTTEVNLTEKSRIKTLTQRDRATTPQPLCSTSSNFSMTLTGLSQHDSEFTLRELCKGYHIVSVSAPTDNITGSSLGKATITVKTTESKLRTLKTNFLARGLKIDTKVAPIGKKNNYAELATVNFLDSFVSGSTVKGYSKKHHLESSQDLFGSSLGVGRFHSGKRIPDEQSLAVHKWNKVRNPKKSEIPVETLQTLPSYMRSTQSSVKKCKKFN